MAQNKRKLAFLLTGVLLFSLLLTPLVFAEETESATGEVSTDSTEETPEVDDATIRSAYLILKLQSQLSQKTTEYNQIQDQIDNTQDELVTTRDDIDSLQDQIDNLDSLIDESEAKIESVTSQIGEAETDISDIMEEIDMRELQIQDQEDSLAEIMTVLYVKKNTYYGDSDQFSTLKLLIAEGSVSDVTQNMVYLDILEQTSQDIFEALKQNKNDLADRQIDLEEKKTILESLQDELFTENENLNTEKTAKETLLDETQGKEDIYQELLVLSKQQQDEVATEMEDLKTNIDLLQGKIDSNGQTLTDEQLDEIMQIKAESLAENGVYGSSEFLQLDWPVDPSGKGLSAYFEDPGYVSAFGVDHHAIDIPIPQGTPLEAPADGVVYKVQYDEESIGYAYIMIAHRKGVVTVYGHVSAVAVSEGDYVYRGQIIGLTGGMPGSIGAGLRTTGSHLHFEVWQDGILVDPLDYLDISVIPIDTLRDDYLERLQNAVEEEMSEIESTLEEMY
ncbi:MAG: peptidoglycan DD-metalloendopeptidase family protein [Candidatus Gracilibacteria bacterium]